MQKSKPVGNTLQQTGVHTAYKLVLQMEVHICNTDNQVIKLKKGEVGNSGSGIKLNIGLLQMSQPARVHNRKARVAKVRLRLVYHISEGKQRGETAKWKPKKGLELL